MSLAVTEIKTYFGQCRCCLNYGYLKNMWKEHYWEGEKEIYVEMLVQCFALSWEQSEDSMEQDQICESCIKRLRDANSFKKIVLESQERLLGQNSEADNVGLQIEIEDGPSSKPEQTVKIEQDYVVEYHIPESEGTDDGMYIDDPDDPAYVDPDDPASVGPDDPASVDPDDRASVDPDEPASIDPDDPDDPASIDPDDPDDPAYVDPDDPDDPAYVDPDDPDDPAYVDPDDPEYEEVEYLEDEDNKVAKEKEGAKEASSEVKVRRTKTPAHIPPNRKWPRRLPKPERHKTYKQYTQEELRRCVEAVKKREMTLYNASVKFNIPTKAICDKAKADKVGLQIEPEDDPSNVLNGNTTENQTDPLKMKSNKILTIFRADDYTTNMNKVKIIKIKSEKSLQTENMNEKDNMSELLDDIKTEEDTDTPLNAEQVRSKYKAIVNEKYKKGNMEPEISVVNEMEKHKHNIKIILETSNATMIKGFWGNGYWCCFCDEQKEIPSELKAHNLEKHGNKGDDAIKVKYVSDLVIRLDITDLKCLLCSEIIDSLDIFKQHLTKKHDKKLHNDIKNYIIPFKFDTDCLKCIHCMKEFKYFKLLSEHMSEHYRNYECPLCERSFVNKQSMQTHSYRHKRGVFKCLHCPKIFDTRPKRSDHERGTHILYNKTRKCTHCDERFSTKDLVQSHEAKVHGAKVPIFNCQACNKSYNSQSSLITHNKRFHLMLRPHKCSYCEMAFFSRAELNSHTVTHTKSRDFKCDVCSKSFGTRCSLNQHVRAHKDDRRFKCNVCERAFVHRTTYRVHMRSKHGKIV